MSRSDEKWSLSGDCAEACTSPAVCPYYWGSSAPTDLHDGKDRCEGAFTFAIRTGHYEKVDLSGLMAGYGFNTGIGGGASGDPWKAVLYLDDRASSEQVRCLEVIFRTCWSLAGDIIKVKRAAISFSKERAGTHERSGFRHTIEWPGTYTMRAEPILARDGTARFISGMTNGVIYVGRSLENRFHDTDLPRGIWDRPGMSNTYFEFAIDPSRLEWVP
jgi:hypothetical protein